jgi:hypothetical protein
MTNETEATPGAGANVIEVNRVEAARAVEKALYSRPADSPLVRHLCAKDEEIAPFLAATQGAVLSQIGRDRPGGGLDVWSILKSLGAGLAVMLPVAWIFSRLPWALLIISALILAGISAAAAKKVATIRHTVTGLALGVVLGGGSYLLWQWFEYQEFREQLRAEISASVSGSVSGLSLPQQDELADRFLEEEVGSPGLLGYFKIMTRPPQPTVRYYQEPPSLINVINVNGVWFPIVRLAELAAATVVGVIILDPRNLPAYCEADQVNMEERRLFPALPVDARRITQAWLDPATRAGEAVLRRMWTVESAAFLHAVSCPRCRQTYLSWRHKRPGKTNLSRVGLGRLSEAAAPSFLEAAKPVAAGYATRELLTYAASVQAARRAEQDGVAEANGPVEDDGPPGA